MLRDILHLSREICNSTKIKYEKQNLILKNISDVIEKPYLKNSAMKTKLHLAILFCFYFLLFNSSLAQNANSIWYFGNHAGLDFNGGSPSSLPNGMLNTGAGCSSIADATGALLFYTDGVTVWNRNHVQMPNGFG